MHWTLSISTVVMALAGMVVGMRLLMLARQTRQLPELAIGSGLFTYAVIVQGGRFIVVGEESTPELRIAILAVRVFAHVVTAAGLAIFTWQVFGVESRWRRSTAAVIVGVALMSSIAIVHDAWIEFNGGPPSPPYSRVLMSVVFLGAFAWTSSEALRYYAMMRRRLALGLADSESTHRFLVWGAGAAVSTALTLFPAATMAAGFVNHPLALVASTLAGFVNAAVWWLTFMPPSWYTRRFQRSGATGSDPNRSD